MVTRAAARRRVAQVSPPCRRMNTARSCHWTSRLRCALLAASPIHGAVPAARRRRPDEHAFDRSGVGDVAGGGGQRLSGPRIAVFAAVAAGADRPGRGHRRGVQEGLRAGAGAVLPAVPAAAAVPGRLAHPQAGPVPRQGRHPGAGAGPGGVHRGRRRLPDPLDDPGDAAGGGVRAGRSGVADRSDRGVLDRGTGADPEAADAHPGGRIAAQRRIRPGLLPVCGGRGDDRHVLAGRRLADLPVGVPGWRGRRRRRDPGREPGATLDLAPGRRGAGRGDPGQPAAAVRRLPAGRGDQRLRHPRRGRRRHQHELRGAERPRTGQHARAALGGVGHGPVHPQRHHVRAARRAVAGDRAGRGAQYRRGRAPQSVVAAVLRAGDLPRPAAAALRLGVAVAALESAQGAAPRRGTAQSAVADHRGHLAGRGARRDHPGRRADPAAVAAHGRRVPGARPGDLPGQRGDRHLAAGRQRGAAAAAARP